MKTIWESTNASTQAGAARVHLVIWDFLKMLVAAILCGLAVSIAVAGITLLLTGSAEARLVQKERVAPEATRVHETENAEIDDPSPTPGALLLGEGCENIVLNAIERDWQVRIDGKHVEVRVMQTLQLPAESTEVATFHVQLINGARIKSLAVQSATKDWAGHLLSADAYERLTPAENLNLSRNRILASHSSRGTVLTSPLLGLKSGEAITIAYTYVMTLDVADDSFAFILPLEAEDKYNATGLPAFANHDAVTSSTRSTRWQSTRGAVWVEWVGRKPTRVMGLPAEADLEISKSRIGGFSWTTHEIQPGARFQLAWTL